MGFIHVHVLNQPCQTFYTIEECLDYASKHIYISWPTGQDLYKRIQNSSMNQVVSHSYGFHSVDFVKGGDINERD